MSAAAFLRDEGSGGLRADQRGAVYVEFLIAFMPVFVFFLCILQLALLYTTKLYVEHAAVQGARAGAVVFGDDPAAYGGSTVNRLTSQRMAVVRRAVVLTLAPLVLDGTVQSVDVTYPNPGTPAGNDALSNHPISPMGDSGAPMLRVNVDAQARCKIAIADRVVCGGLLGLGDSPGWGVLGLITKRVRGTAVFPYQGARYTYR